MDLADNLVVRHRHHMAHLILGVEQVEEGVEQVAGGVIEVSGIKLPTLVVMSLM